MAGTIITNLQNDLIGLGMPSEQANILGKINYSVSVVGSGTAYTLTAVSAAVDLGTTDPVIVLNSPGTYHITGQVRLEYVGATFAASRTVTTKVRRTNNTAADLTGGTVVTNTAVVTTVTQTFMIINFDLPPYTTANNNDSITIFADVSVIPTAGTFTAASASLQAVRLY